MVIFDKWKQIEFSRLTAITGTKNGVILTLLLFCHFINFKLRKYFHLYLNIKSVMSKTDYNCFLHYLSLPLNRLCFQNVWKWSMQRCKPHITSIVSIFKMADADVEGSRWSHFLYTVNYCMLAVTVLFIFIHWQPLNQYIITNVIQDKLQWM